MKRGTAGQNEVPVSDSLVYEEIARLAGWVAEKEYNSEADGVRNPFNGDWAENWEGAVMQIVEGYHVATGRQPA